MESFVPSTSGASTSSNNGNNVNENTVSSTSPRLCNEDGVDQIRTCCTCKHSVKDKPSKLLACLHTVCPPCYISNANGGEFECLICRVKSTSCAIVENFIAHGLDANAMPVIKCNNELCQDGGVATVHCDQCNENLCAKCKDAHLRIKYTKDHKLTPVPGNRASAILPTACAKHPHEELSLFCTVCSVLTCRDCQLSPEHDGHHSSHKTLQDAAAENKRRVAEFAVAAMSKTGGLVKEHQLAQQRLRSVAEKRDALNKQLREASWKLLNLLQSRTATLADEIKQACEEQEREYRSILEPLEQTIAMAKQAAYFSEAAASLRDKHALLHSIRFIQAHTEMINERKKSLDLSVLRREAKPVTCQLPIRDLAEKIQQFGTVISGTQDVPGARSTSNGSATSASSTSSRTTAAPQQLQSNSHPNLQNVLQHQPQQQVPRQRHHSRHAQGQETARTVQKVSPGSSCHHPASVGALRNSGAEQRMQSPPAPLVSPTASVPQLRSHLAQRQSQQTTTPQAVRVPPNVYMSQPQHHQHSSPAFPRPTQQQIAAQYHLQLIRQQQPQVQVMPPQHQQFNGVYAAGIAHGGVRHNSPPSMPHSPSGVSSTTVTPPSGHCANHQHAMPTCDQHQITAVPNHFNQAALQPPPLYSAIQELNVQAINQHPQVQYQLQQPAQQQPHLHYQRIPIQQQLQQQQMQRPPQMVSSSIFPDPASIQMRLVAGQQYAARVAPQATMPTLRPPPPAYDQSQSQAHDASNQHRHTNACQMQAGLQASAPVDRPNVRPETPLEASSPVTFSALAALSQEPIDLVRNRATSGDVNGYRSSPAIDPKADIPAASPIEPSTSAPVATTEVQPEPSTMELTPISPATIDNSLAMTDAFDQLRDLISTPAPPDQEATPAEPPKEVAESESVDQNLETSPTPAPNVSSTTMDGENSQSAFTNRLESSPQPASVIPRRYARKTIASRAYINSGIDGGPGQPSTAAPALLSALDDDTGVSNMFAQQDRSRSIETPPLEQLAAENGTNERRSPIDDNVTTTERPNGQVPEEQMPEGSARSWDDYCAVCNNGGTLVCCDGPSCRFVFHHDHHIPELDDTPTGEWFCNFCTDLESFKTELDQVPWTERKAMTEYELKICQRILLKLYTETESMVFHEPVDENITEYFDVIKNPMDFSAIRRRLNPRNEECYKNVLQFIKDLNQVFINCDEFNTEDREPQVRNAGVIVGQEYLDLVRTYFPDLVPHVKLTKPSTKRKISRTSSNESASSASNSVSARRRRVVLEGDD